MSLFFILFFPRYALQQCSITDKPKWFVAVSLNNGKHKEMLSQCFSWDEHSVNIFLLRSAEREGKKTSRAPQWDGTAGALGMRSAITMATSLDTNSIRKQQTLFLLDLINRNISFCYIGWNKTCSFFFLMCRKNSLCFWIAHQTSTATVQRSAGSHLQPIQLTGMLESTTKWPAEWRSHSVTCKPSLPQPNPSCAATSLLLMPYTSTRSRKPFLPEWTF